MFASRAMRIWLAAVLLALGNAAHARAVLLISIDGLRPADALAEGGHAPNLRQLAHGGMWSDRVLGTMPSLTYPAHTTLVTGASPARHGIGGNEAFDPLRRNQEGWLWYFSDVTTDTLWTAARRRGLKTAAINWPVTVGAPIDWNLPQYWRSGTAEDSKLIAALASPGLVGWLERKTGKTMPLSRDGSAAADGVRAEYAAALWQAHRPALLTVHLESLDHALHDFGPGSPEAAVTLAELDRIVARLVSTARRTDPAMVVIIVSDHGFLPVAKAVNLDAALRDAGLLVAGPEGEVTAWQAAVWPMSGSAAIVLRDPADAESRARTRRVLDGLAADPASGIAAILDPEAIGSAGGTGRAAFWVVFKPGYITGGYASGGLLQEAWLKGSHGQLPQTPGMEALFIASGRGIGANRALGQVDMRAIAPLVALTIGTRLRDAELPGIAVPIR